MLTALLAMALRKRLAEARKPKARIYLASRPTDSLPPNLEGRGLVGKAGLRNMVGSLGLLARTPIVEGVSFIPVLF